MKTPHAYFHILKKSRTRGFTLIELMVTIVIFVALTLVVVFNQNGFNNSILLSNLAYDVALTIRQTQTYGVGVRENISNTGQETFSSYGLYFNTNQSALGNAAFIVFTNPAPHIPFFTSQNYNCAFGDPQCIQKYGIKNGITISSICVGTSASSCMTQANSLYIMFYRPKPDAIIYANDQDTTTWQYAKITLKSATGATTSVVVSSVGQIYVSN